MFGLRRPLRIMNQVVRENSMKQQIPSASQPTLLVETAPGMVEKVTLESRYLILIHNDEVTPYDYVIRTLERIFLLSEEMADHIATTAHHEGTAVVMVRPRNEAERLIKLAHSRARLDGYPLTFSMEQE
jgi:ATP-dependent Clp protease adaptor protein ClpS